MFFFGGRGGGGGRVSRKDLSSAGRRFSFHRLVPVEAVSWSWRLHGFRCVVSVMGVSGMLLILISRYSW